jgi:HAD superfamily hydrolase (TIGR01549 family)
VAISRASAERNPSWSHGDRPRLAEDLLGGSHRGASVAPGAILAGVPDPSRSTAELRGVLFDVDFTLARPGPELGPEGYRRLGERHGLTLDPLRYDEARARAMEELQRHPELEHDDEIWVLFTERIIRGMGGDAESAYECAAEMTRAWELHHNFELYEDVLPVLGELRGYGLRLGLVSNTGRDLDAFVAHHRLEVDVAIGSRAFGRTKPHRSIFTAALERLGVEPAAAAMIGDSPDDDVEGARALGMRAFLLDREARHPEWGNGRLPSLFALPAALGLVRPG